MFLWACQAKNDVIHFLFIINQIHGPRDMLAQLDSDREMVWVKLGCIPYTKFHICFKISILDNNVYVPCATGNNILECCGLSSTF